MNNAVSAALKVARRRGYADGGDVAPDDPALQSAIAALREGRVSGEPPLTSARGLPGSVAGVLAPHLTDYLGSDRPPVRDITGLPPGKVPSTQGVDDPRLPGVMGDIAGIGGSALTGIGLAGAGVRAAEAALPGVASRAGAMDPQIMAGITGAMGNAVEPAEATTLTREQRRQVEMERQRAELATKAEEARLQREQQANLQKSDLENKRQRDAAQAELDRKRQQSEFEAAERLKESNLPFRQKYPNLAATLPFLGTTSSFLAPFLTRTLMKVPASNVFAKAWTDTADEAERALAAGEHAAAARALNQLEAYGQQYAKQSKGVGAAAFATSAALPAEAALVPSEYDAAVLPANDPNRKAAMDLLTDPIKVAERAAPGVLQGLPAATLGSKLPTPIPQRLTPVARSEGLLRTYPDRGTLAVRGPSATLALTPAEQKHFTANADALTDAVPSAKLRGDRLEMDPDHSRRFLDFIDQSRAGKQPGDRLPPSFYRPKLLESRIKGSPGFAHGGRVVAANINHAPTEAQKKAGNYAKDHLHVAGMPITIEGAKGSTRTGTDRNGKMWKSVLSAHYGYIKRTEGADKDHLDVFIGPYPKSPKVFVVDQKDAETDKFDEHKLLLGFPSKFAAINTYLKAFSDGKGGNRLGNITEMSIDGLKHWIKHGDTTKPFRRK